MAPDGIVFNIKFTGDSKNAVESARRVVEAINGAGAAAKDLAKKAQGELGGAGGSVSYTQAAKGVGSVTASTTLQSTEQAAENARRASSKAFNEIQHNFNATMNAATRMVNGLRQVFQGLQELGFYLSTFVTAPLVLLAVLTVTSGFVVFEGAGKALGFHSGFSGVDWNRSPAGELAYRLKYQGDASALEPVVKAILDLCAGSGEWSRPRGTGNRPGRT